MILPAPRPPRLRLLGLLVAAGCGGAAPGGAPAPAADAPPPAALEVELADLRAELDALTAELGAVRAENRGLLEELAEERALRYEREVAWLDYTSAVAELDVAEMIRGSFAPQLPEVASGPPEPTEPPEPAPSPEELVRRERVAAMLVSLRNLMRIEEVRGFDLLELGELREAEEGHGTVGPVVFRLLDDRGRLAGSLFAERMRLEGSRAAHTITLLLEDGYEARGGERFPFAGGERRIVLPHVDPVPWMETLPELFAMQDRREALDDGLWDLERVERDLNDKLREDAAGGFYVLHRYEGVRGGVLVDVQLSGFDEGGRLERRLFCDRLRIVPQERGVQLVLEDGAILRGDGTTPFPGGVFRIFLPTADVEAWRAARLPGLVEPPSLSEEPPAEPGPVPAPEAGADARG